MGLLDKLFKKNKNKNIKNAIQDFNEELEILEETSKAEQSTDEETTKTAKQKSVAVAEESIEVIKEVEKPVEVIKEVEESVKVIEEAPIEVIEQELVDSKAVETVEDSIEVIEDIETIEEKPVEVIEEPIETVDSSFKMPDDSLEDTVEEVGESIIEETPKKQGFMKRLFGGLTKTRENIAKGVDAVLSSFKQIDEDLYEELEEALIIADFGVTTTLHIIEELKAEVKARRITDPLALKPTLQEIITDFLTSQPSEEVLSPTGPTVLLVIGVNGVGKTTSIGKMAHLFKSQGKRVLVAAADTFRAAAIEQLNVWTERAGVEIIKQSEGSDAAAVVFDAIAAAKSRKVDVLICDTAGRLQNKTNLMKELEKISRIIAREYPKAKKEILIVIDATTGQNALQQVKLFKEVADINGIILTKLDGTAKGGAIVSIYDSLKVPVKYIGVGEKIDDLQPFNAQDFAKALFDETE